LECLKLARLIRNLSPHSEESFKELEDYIERKNIKGLLPEGSCGSSTL
jgi:hypothetical protein